MSNQAGDNVADAWSTTAQQGSVSSGHSCTVARDTSASHARAGAYVCENVGLKAAASTASASERAEQQQKSMQALLKGMPAIFGVASGPVASQDVANDGDGMLRELEELWESEKTQKK